MHFTECCVLCPGLLGVEAGVSAWLQNLSVAFLLLGTLASGYLGPELSLCLTFTALLLIPNC